MIKTIDDVIILQTAIVTKAIKEKARYGYFAALYLQMTKALMNFIPEKKFKILPKQKEITVGAISFCLGLGF